MTQETALLVAETAIIELHTGDLLEVRAWDSGVRGLVLTQPPGEESTGRVHVTHEHTGAKASGFPLSVNNARQYAHELGTLGDWTQMRSVEDMAPVREAASRAWVRAEDRDCAEGGAP